MPALYVVAVRINHYSLATGSSWCIQCSSNSHVSLFLFFIAAGIILVIFTLASNLTVTQGLINGVVPYANILWTYKDILFPSEQKLLIAALQIFIAWLNLDNRDMSCSWSDCLLESMVSVSLYLVHCWSHHHSSLHITIPLA